MKKETEIAKDYASNSSKATEVRRSSTQDFISEEKEVQVSQLPQETDAVCESTKEEEATEVKRRRPYRTKAKAGNTDKVPSHLLVITNEKYQNAMSLNKNDTAYIQMVSDNSKLKFENGILTFKGLPAISAELQELYTEERIEKINIPLLMVIYSVIHEKFSRTKPENQNINERINIYYPELAKGIGKSPKITKSDVQDCMHSIKLFEKLLRIIINGTGSTDILPVIYNAEYNSTKNVISFTSPYIVKLIKEIYTISIRTNKKQTALKKNGQPQMFLSHSYMINMYIAKEKNKKALEIVFIVMAVIEQAGNYTPHIKAETIIERSCLLKHSLQEQTTSGNKTNILKRAFTKAWELLKKKTCLTSVYKDIELPDPKDISVIPTSSTLDIVFELPHHGKPKKPAGIINFG